MKIETQKSKTTFKLTIDAKEYWLIIKALGTLDNYEIEDILKDFDDGDNTNEFINIKHNLYVALISKIIENTSHISSDAVYEQFKLVGEFE